MYSDNEQNKILPNQQANLELARERAEGAHQILIRFKEMGLSEHYDEDLAKLCTDLADLWSIQNLHNELLLGFLENKSNDWQFAAEFLTDIKSHIDHMAWHIGNVNIPIERIALQCYDASNSS